jgi:arginyl-tRNA synthetase
MITLLAEQLQPVLGSDAIAVFDVPDNEALGHYSTNVAFTLAKERDETPLAIAEDIAQKLRGNTIFSDVKAVAPGFVNIWVAPEVFYNEIDVIRSARDTYGSSTAHSGKKARIEYVSANPTGPIHIGNARGGPLGETLARTFQSQGYKVLREYIHNDVGSQVEKLTQSLWYWYQAQQGVTGEFPEDGYKGEYVREVAERAFRELGSDLRESDLEKLTAFALKALLQENIEMLDTLGIHFDAIIKESELIRSGDTQSAIDELTQKGVTKENDGALWFAPKDDFLEDREAVLVRSTGEPTYFASDIAYHRQKFTSGYDIVIDVFGSGHHGHVPKLQALTKLFGFENDFSVLLYQNVRLKRGDELVKMSKRAGTYVTAQEVIEEVGVDSMIFFLLMHAPTSHMDFDLALAKERSIHNPVYYFQYAYVRAKSILSKSEGVANDVDLIALSSPQAMVLMRTLVQFPDVIARVARTYEVHRLAHYATDLARAFHAFYETSPVIGEKASVMHARLALVEASAVVCANLMKLLSISTPEKM